MAIKRKTKRKLTRNYLAKDFDALRGDLLRYAQVFYPDNMQDFTDASLGGLFLDMAAYVGDSMSFYLDHQFRELDPTTAIEAQNIERHARNSGVKIMGASPAVADVQFYVKVRAIENDGVLVPQPDALPIINEGTVLMASNGTKFTLTEDLDFSQKDYFGNLIAKTIRLKKVRSIDYFALVLTGLCVSGEVVTEDVTIASARAFREVQVSRPNVSAILSVFDSEGNEYFEVDSLSQDTVFTAFPNVNEPYDNVPSVIGIKAAPYRFTTSTDLTTRRLRLRFGGGTEVGDDGVPDPSDLALPLYGKTTMKKFSIDPNALLNTSTLGFSPSNTKLHITYRHGGGRSHNVPLNTINEVNTLRITFVDSLDGVIANEVRNSIEVKNPQPASGGAAQKTVEEIRQLIPAARSMQSRVVTKEDLLARLYTLPNEYGVLYRAAITENPNNPLGSLLYVVSTDASGRLTQAPDVLKQNISTYINEFRLISDSIDILDVQIINYRVDCNITVAPSANKFDVISMVIEELTDLLRLSKFQVGQPIIEADLINAVINIQGVLSLIEINITNLTGVVNGRTYSNQSYSMVEAKSNGIYFPPTGGIFEMRFATEDIRVTVR